MRCLVLEEKGIFVKRSLVQIRSVIRNLHELFIISFRRGFVRRRNSTPDFCLGTRAKKLKYVLRNNNSLEWGSNPQPSRYSLTLTKHITLVYNHKVVSTKLFVFCENVNRFYLKRSPFRLTINLTSSWSVSRRRGFESKFLYVFLISIFLS